MGARHTAPSTLRSRFLLPFVTVVACVGDGGGTGQGTHGTDGTATSEAPSTDTASADSTGASIDSCIDDYHGNQAHQTALDLLLDTTETAFIVLGDGFAANPPEHDNDELVVCDAAASDFFGLEVQCPSFLAIEARALGSDVPEVLLYENPVSQTSQPVEQVMGSWHDFVLKPLQWEVGPGYYVIEARHSGGAPLPYSLAVVVLPDSPCQPP